MNQKSRSKADEKYLKELGKRISLLIQKNGYPSPYTFWLEHGGDGLSRSNLNYILNGKTDPKILTLRKISESLNVELSEIINGQ